MNRLSTTLVPGASAYRWVRRARLVIYLWTLPSMTGMAATALIARAFQGVAVLDDIFVPLSVTGVVAELLVIWVGARRREWQEVRAGYTTLVSVHQKVDQVAPDTDVIIRAAGDPYLMNAQFKALVKSSAGEACK